MSRQLRIAAAASIVGALAVGGIAHAGVGLDGSGDGDTSGNAKATLTGNPLTSSIGSAPPPPAPLPVAVPALPALPVAVPTALPPLPATPVSVPRGASPSDHIYVTTTSAQPVSYAVAAFALPAGLQADTLTVSFSDDNTTGEDASADTADLVLCPLTAALNPSAPDDPATFDCSHPVTMQRKATSGGGTWTGDTSSFSSNVASDGVFGVAVLPLATSATSNSSVAILRGSVSVAYHGTTLTSSSTDSSVGTATPASAVASALPVAEAPTIPNTVPAPASTDTGSVTAPMTAADGTQTPALATQAATSPADDRWRPLLLLLVPAVPLLVLGLYRRLRDAEGESEDDLLSRYPGLAQLLG